MRKTKQVKKEIISLKMNRVRSLTSTAVPEASDKNYEWHMSSLLIPHEALRRELMRANGALNNMSM